jgi:imidazole glycerol-phosphate synthase subunit HisH
VSAAREVVVCRTGTANLASIFAGLRRAGGAPRMAERATDVEAAGHVMLPGVGSFGAAMATLRESGMVEPLRARFAAGRPTMAICVGLQLLCRSSEETPGVEGLAVIEADVARFPESVRVPQFGWNRVVPNTDCRLIAEGHAYFANSYRLAERTTGWAVAIADHGGTYIAAMEKGPLLACQFHPELSGAYGHALLSRWIALPC